MVWVPEPKFSNISVRVLEISDQVAGFRFGLLVTDIFEHPFSAGSELGSTNKSGDHDYVNEHTTYVQQKQRKFPYLNRQ